jgi:hypothetical protein
VAGEDRFKQAVTAEGVVRISDDEDATKLRFFADTDTLQVGAAAKLRLHSRLDGGLALLTFEGDSIIAHRIITLKKGFNNLALDVDHVHFPNFTACVTAMDGRELRVAQRGFRVERQLNVTVTPKQKIYDPSAEAEVELTVTDQLGKPVVGELSLALVDEALYALFGDGTPSIRDFFQKDATRKSDFHINSSTGFEYTAVTQKVLKELLDEVARLERKDKERNQLKAATKQLQEQQLALGRPQLKREMMELAQKKSQFIPRRNSGMVPGMPITGGNKSSSALASAVTPGAGGGFGGEGIMSGEKSGKKGANPSGFFPYPNATRGERRPLQTGNGRFALDRIKGKDFFAFRLGDLNGDGEDAGGAAADPVIRRELAGAGHWLPAVVTDAKGKATVKFTLPSSASEWRLTARGVTVQTLVGQARRRWLRDRIFS